MPVSNILDKVHSNLPYALWENADADLPILKPVHRKWIINNVHHALDQGGYSDIDKWLHLYLSGSLTTYQYSATSDVDVSLFVDTKVFPEWSRAEMIGIMIEKLDGTILPGTHYPMQDFVVAKEISPKDIYKVGLRSAYDITLDKWYIPPDRSRSHDVESWENGFYVYAQQMADKMERLLRYEPDKAVDFWHQIHSRRQRDQQKGKGDYSESNIIYKFLANRGLFPKISEQSGEHIAAWQDHFLEQLPQITEEYDRLPVYDPNAHKAWQELANDSVRRAAELGNRYNIQVVDDEEPYANAHEMFNDLNKGRFLVSRANCEHPLWTPDENIAFRTVHDILGHHTSGGDFNWQGENLACGSHFPLLNPEAQKALMTECLGQTGSAIFNKGFGPQKVGFMDRILSPAQESYNQRTAGIPAGGFCHRHSRQSIYHLPNRKISSAPVEPPNFCESTDEKKCGNCKMYDKGVCWGYGNKPVGADDVCDSWAKDTT